MTASHTTTGVAQKAAPRRFAMERQDAIALLALLPAVLLFVSVTLIPLGWAFNASLHLIDPFSPDWEWTGIGQYADVLSRAEFWRASLRSLVFGAASTALQLCFGILIAVALNRPFPGTSLVRAMVFVAYLLPPIVIALTFKWMTLAQNGVINDILLKVGILSKPVPFFGTPETALAALVFVASWQYTGFVTLMVIARLQSIPDRLYDAARMDGAGPVRQFFDITLPQIRSVVLVVLLLRFVWMFNKFDLLYTTTKGGPGESTRTLPIYIFETAFTNFELGAAAAIAMLLFVQLLVVAIIFFMVSGPDTETRT
ncbi:carbohydrate ABC transporter permease [Acuticoccus kandeliae]|uniref:carbohydrate ABC transporter permease n=1 Tax=Acuticoccus kandeliae TaxID=2073160 RepID=UPI000D3E3A46|nr:sugar ABC transporter permease [Acuticoccus kandeliae]